jgi:hypothetical protein
MKEHLKKARRFILKYWLAISIGSVLEVKAVELAYEERGYMAYGGEYCVLPLVVMTAYLLNQIVPAVWEVFHGEDDDRADSTRNDVHYTKVSGRNRNHR